MFRKSSSTPTADTPEQYPAVEQAAAKVAELTGRLARADAEVIAAEEAYAEAEAVAAAEVISGDEPPDLSDSRLRIRNAAERQHLSSLALEIAKHRQDEALEEAKRQHWAVQWRFYQDKIQAFDTALSAAFEAQEEARLAWVAVGQPGEVPLLKAPLANWQPYFHTFLRDILDMPAASVRRGVSFALESGPGLPPRAS